MSSAQLNMGFGKAMPFKTKLTVFSAMLVSVALLLATIGLVGLQYLTEDRLADQRHEQITQVIAANTGPALLFADTAAAEENLMSIEGIEDVEAARLYDVEGQIFASFKNANLDQDVQLAGLKSVMTNVVVDQEMVGKLEILVDDRSIFDIIAETWLAMLILFSICLILSMIFAGQINKIAFAPIGRLSDAMQKVTVSNDYTMRLAEGSDPDFALITRNFNKMVETVSHRDEALVEKAQQLTDARDEAEQANVAKSQFLANMSHELRTPLNAIVGYTDVLKEELKSSSNMRSLDDVQWISSSAQQLLELINSILDLSKIEAGRMDVDVHEFDVARIVHEVGKMIEPAAAQKNNKVHVQVAENLGIAHTDSVKLRQSLLNLGSNAAKFTENGRIFILARREDNELVFSVSDTGIGMTEEQVGRLFQPFSQADASTTRRFGGTGLGLTITQRFCDMLGGSIEVESKEGNGSTFTLRIKADFNSPDNQEGPDAEEGSDTEENSAYQDIFDTSDREIDHSKPLAIVIDDEPSAAKLLERMAVQAGYSTIAAPDGQSGLDAIRKKKPALILLDISMPKVDGFDVLETLRHEAALASIPVVIVSVSDDRKSTLNAGACEHLIKPVSSAEVSAVLSQYAQQRSGRVLIVEDDEATARLYSRGIERAGYTVSVATNGREAQDLLTANEFDFVVTDLRMPEIDGHDLIDWIAEFAKVPKPALFVVTGKAMSEAETKALEEKVQRILPKNGLSPSKLAAALTQTDQNSDDMVSA